LILYYSVENPALEAFQEKLGYIFSDSGLLAAALCHSSFAYEKGLPGSNQRLEFLGDSVLGMLVAKLLYDSYPNATEGELSAARVKFVCRDALVKWSEHTGLPTVLMKGKSLKNPPPSIFADAMEAVLGAVYLEGGHDAAEFVIRRYFLWTGILFTEKELDAKSKLHVLLQGEEMGLPVYEVESMTGPSHSPNFRVRVTAAGRQWTSEGASRKAAELNAAALAFEALTFDTSASKDFIVS